MLNTSSARQRLALAVAVVALAAPSLLAAQLRTEFTPFVASYYGVTHLGEGTGGPLAGNAFTVDQNNAFAAGARITLPVGGRLAIEGEFTYSASGLSITEKDAITTGIDGGASQKGNVMFGSIRAVISPRRSNLFLLVGPAIVTRGGDAWKGVKKSDITDFGGVVGLGIRASVTPRFRINFTAESYLYSFNGGGTKSKFQSDILVSLGVPIALSH